MGIEALHARFVDHAYPPHSHPTWTVAVVEKGAARFSLDATQQRADEGELFVLEPEAVHTGMAAVPRPNDVVPGTVLVDGFVAATWGQEIKRAAATLTVEPLRPLSRREASAVAAEGRRLLRWSAPRDASSALTVTVMPA